MNIVALTNDSELSRHTLRQIHARFPLQAVVVEARRRPWRAKLRWWLITRPRSYGWLRTLDQAAFIIYKKLFLEAAENRLRRRMVFQGEPAPDWPPQVPLRAFDSVNAPECADYLRGLAPDVILVLGTSVLKPEVIAAAKNMALNIHCGIIPEYRGGGNFWAFYRGDLGNVGVSIHKVDAGIDTGDILYQQKIPFTPGQDTLASHYFKCILAGTGLFLKALEDLAQGRAQPYRRQAPDGFFPSHTLTEYLRTAARLRRGG
ncbi:MAG: formyl transferase [Elusimicrobiota bacterium]|jgi:hypothetical protein